MRLDAWRTLPVWVVTMDNNGSKMKVDRSPEQFEVPIKLSGAGAASSSQCAARYWLKKARVRSASSRRASGLLKVCASSIFTNDAGTPSDCSFS